MDDRSRRIFERQNTPENLNVLKAAKSCYSHGKTFGVFNVLLTVTIPICLNILMHFNQNKVVEAIFIVISVIAWMLGYLCKKEFYLSKLNGASLQQQFDIAIFDLKLESDVYNKEKEASFATKEKLTSKYQAKKDDSIINWYSDYSKFPYEQAVFYCQKENIDWDIELRKKYRNFLCALAILTTVLLVVDAIYIQVIFYEFVISCVPLLPLVSFFCNGIKKLNDDINRYDEIYNYVNKCDEKISNGQKASEDELLENIKSLQLLILKHRKSAYMIPTWFYKIFKTKMQKEADDLALYKNSNRRS